MTKRLLWSTLIILSIAVLLIVSCGPKAAPKPTPTPAPAPAPGAITPAPAPVTPTPTPASAEKPKYGGTLTMLLTTDPTSFDTAFGNGPTLPITNEYLMEKDWTKGPAGTNELFFDTSVPAPKYMKGQLAESWKIPEVGVMVYQIRRGVHYALNPQSEASKLVNGRELTADDIVYSVKRVTTMKTAYAYFSSPEMARAATVEKTGPWEVTIKTPEDPAQGFNRFFWGVGFWPQVPEVVQKYGDMKEWRNSVGTGAFMLADYVPSSVVTLIKNPNYWDKDPIGPGKGNQLPYIDTLKLLIIADISTQMAAFRTGRLDLAYAVASGMRGVCLRPRQGFRPVRSTVRLQMSFS
ncbi:MAG: hypothetical protein HY663_05690 [Chloroflexi bacterium]|nr:hypothetical protein [Chloroflexota bacterium]